VAKKKATRKGARGARKATARRSPRKAASRPREGSRQVRLKPLQAIIKSKIKQLESYPPSPKVEETLKLMGDVKAMLDNACRSNPIPMVIEF
jgi:hypothetical protein